MNSYTVSPEHYNKYYATTSPHGSREYVEYVPAAFEYATPTKGHRRQASHNPSPRAAGYYYSSPGPVPAPKDSYSYAAGPAKEAYVSYDKRPRASSYSKPTSKTYPPRTTGKQAHPIHVYESGDEYAQPRVVNRDVPSRTKSKHAKKPSTDSYFYFGQEQIYNEQPKKSSHARKPSGTTKTSPQKSRPRKSIPQATEADAKRAGIPVGYSIKNWDPSELPIILLGSVFDANSLGKWIYDWTVYTHGAKSPIADMAGDLWLLLIKLAGKTKRAEERVNRIRNPDDHEMVEEFIESGSRLWKKFKLLLKDCEYYMMSAAKQQGSKTLMGKNAGTEFVESIFGRDRHLEDTEKIMNNIRLWTMRFDVNCEDIIRRPSYA